jgi:ABC-type transport system involved in multi-copper enzyme maturation permease subunit
MLNLYRAEVRKIMGNRWMAGLLVWIWPIGGLALPLIVLVLALLIPTGSGHGVMTEFQWTDAAIGAWILPTNLFGRLLFVSLAAAAFAGEYQWGTWKTIVPRADRIRLVLAKYLAFASLLVVAFFLASITLTFGIGLIQAARGLPYPPVLTADVLQTFVRDYLLQMLLTVINTLIGVAFGAILATLSRSILGGILGGIAFIAGEIGFVAGVTTLGFLFKSGEIAGLGRFTSAMSIANVSSWVQTGRPLPALFEGAPTHSLAASFAVLLVWLVGLVTLNLWLFQRQDLS